MITLELKEVDARYGRRKVLDAVSTPVVRGGDVVALIGPNAAGKSTLLRRIAGLIGGSGQVIVETGTPRAARICYMPQDIAANAMLSVFESVLLAVKQTRSWRVDDEALRRVERALRDLGIEDLAFRNLTELSGGQRQLVSLAQTLGREPDVMLLDEPTSALDLRHQCDVAAAVRRVARDRQIVVVVSIHDLNQALQLADKVLVLSGGRLAAFGTSRDVVTPPFLAEVYGVHVRIETLGDQPHVVVLNRL